MCDSLAEQKRLMLGVANNPVRQFGAAELRATDMSTLRKYADLHFDGLFQRFDGQGTPLRSTGRV